MDKLSDSFADTLVGFLDQREGDGLPIKVLDITEAAARERWNWGFLERMEGLKVTWVKNKVIWDYICGSGAPEKLDLLVCFLWETLLEGHRFAWHLRVPTLFFFLFLFPNHQK
jgi:hypothetical protein